MSKLIQKARLRASIYITELGFITPSLSSLSLLSPNTAPSNPVARPLPYDVGGGGRPSQWRGPRAGAAACEQRRPSRHAYRGGRVPFARVQGRPRGGVRWQPSRYMSSGSPRGGACKGGRVRAAGLAWQHVVAVRVRGRPCASGSGSPHGACGGGGRRPARRAAGAGGRGSS